MEEWKEIAGFPGYEVSNTGKVITHHWLNTDETKELKPSKHLGYLQVVLCKNGTQKTKRIHRLVAEAFIPNPSNLKEVNHIDGDKENNHVSNLEWCTRKENMNHAFSTGLADNCTKSFKDMAKRKRRKVIAKRISDGKEMEFLSTVDAEKALGISTSRISQCANGKRNKSHGYTFRYVEG